MTHQRLRYIEAIPIEDEDGQRLVVLRDPEELFVETLAVPLPTFALMSLFNGQRDARDVQAEVQRNYGQLLPVDRLESLLAQMDEFYLIENERTAARRAALQKEFAAMKTRPAAHAGTAYPEDPAELAALLDRFFERPRAERGKRAAAPRGLVTPHIDIREGGECLAWAFNELDCPEPPELYVILGVAHYPTPNLFTFTNKDFETPLGPARVHAEALARMRELCGAEGPDGEFAHKNEHSVEFQTVFLKHLHRDAHDFKIVPVLCGSIDELTANGGSPPRERDEVGRFIGALRAVVEEFGPRVCVIAGVDLSHVGPKFGMPDPIDDLRAGIVEAADRRMLEAVAAGRAEDFFDHFRPDNNARNVDAVSAVYTMLHALAPASGELLQYAQFREAPTQSMVSYASMALR
jgi:hypothetical protein